MPTTSMKPSPPCDAASHSGSQELPKMLWNLLLCYCVHKSLRQVTILCQYNPAHAALSRFTKILLLLCLNIKLSLIQILSHSESLHAQKFLQRISARVLKVICYYEGYRLLHSWCDGHISWSGDRRVWGRL